MKVRLLCSSLCLVLVFFSLVNLCLAGVTTIHLSFKEDQIVNSVEYGYDLLEMKSKDCFLRGIPGSPFLPVKILRVAIPSGATVQRVVGDQTSYLLGIYNILPAQQVVRPGTSAAFMGPDPSYYKRQTRYPSQVVEHVGTGTMRGYTLVTLKVYPLQYIPANKQVYLNHDITINVEWAEHAGEVPVPYTDDLVIKNIIKESVANPDEIEKVLNGFNVIPYDGGNEIKYLIITGEALAADFQTLAEWKTRKGIPAVVVTVESIYSSYPGTDSQEKIKQCILDYAQNYGVLWVLLGGDDSVVPDRDCYGRVLTAGGYETDATIPTDLYYAGLDDLNWNDNEGLPCELSDTIDMEPDVFIGRAPVRSHADAAAFVSKTINYDRVPASNDFLERMILIGTKLWSYVDGQSDAYWRTERMYAENIDPWWDFTRYMFYDTATSFVGNGAYALNAAHAQIQLNSGYNLIFMCSHGDWNSWGLENGSYLNSDAAQLINSGKQGHIYTIACLSNAFDKEPCLSESFIRNPNGGAVSYIGCSRYGWDYAEPMVHGPSFQYADRFYYNLFVGNPSESGNTVGAVFSAHKYDLVGLCDTYDAWRWLQFGLNLMGDPELSMRTEDPEIFTVSYSKIINRGPQTFQVSVGVSDALVCLYKGTEVYAYGRTNQAGDYTADINPFTAGDMLLTISRYNYRSYEDTVRVLDSIPVALPAAGEYGRIKSGEQTHVNEIQYSFEGTTGNVTIDYEAYDIDSTKEVQILINGQRAGYMAVSPNDGWGGPFSIILSDNAVNDDSLNILAFDNTSNPPKSLWWGVRNVSVNGADVPDGIPLPAGKAYGRIKNGDEAHTDQVTYWFEGRSGNVVIRYGAYDIDSAKEVQILVNGQSVGYVSITPNNGWAGPFTIMLPDNLVNDASSNTLVFDNTYNPPNLLWWGIRNVALQ
jgi:hypothetical protein